MFLPSLIFCENRSFNRYMVECELRFISVILTAYRVLIDTWWNVNVGSIKGLTVFEGF